MLQAKNSTKLFKKVRLKFKIQNEKIIFNLLILWLICVCIKCVECNRPPRFIIEGHSEIVLRLKEGQDTPIGKTIFFCISLTTFSHYFPESSSLLTIDLFHVLCRLLWAVF